MTSPATILVVEAKASVRSLLEQTLARDGHQVVAVERGEAALADSATHEFDLALIDLGDAGGLAVLSALRERAPDTVAIVLASHTTLEIAIEALRQGAHDCLLEPLETAKLRESVRRAALKRRQELQRRVKSRLIPNFTHELHAPITNIGLHLHLLERCDSEKRAYHLDMIKQETSRMARLTESMLILSRLEAGRVEEELAPTDLNALARQTVAAHQVRAEAGGLELTFEPGGALPPVRAARSQLSQVIANLLTNAINYTPAGRVRVSTYLDAGRERACLQVQDTGLGIAPEDLPHLFERFYRCQGVAGSNAPGSGLGLAIVKEIVDLHQGEIEVESQVGAGSTFKVWLPLDGREA